MRKLIVIQTVVPDYRKKFFSYLKERSGPNFSLYGGNNYFERSVVSDQTIEFYNHVNNFFLFKRKMLFQLGGFWKEILKHNIMVLEMNPRILSNWIILLLRKTFGRKTVLWGHAWPRDGNKSKRDLLRHILRSLGDEIIVYTQAQKKELELKMPEKTISCAPNSVCFSSEMQAFQAEMQHNNIIYVGRLTKGKKVFLLIRAFYEIMERLPRETSLLIVGEGEEREVIEKFIDSHGLGNRVKMFGHVGDYNALKKLYDSSLISVSPGYIGLSVTQSFGFGVPMVVSDDEPHSPEIECVVEGENSMYFRSDDINDLAEKLTLFFENRPYWVGKRNKIKNFCAERYSIEKMAKPFLSLIN
ncbi:glycosyltransferase [Sinomicrobium pectinilyticum]|uniref:Glycosyltransferase n=1 Tax=Sinomicrobium pectinilyticum TaxID=1084421 RepID=A0A3N0E6U1_SINP1|nr:glycosyltransferase [Sinomicrobium pectinilyticum]RNL83545.1 glycosyltransferase [Sinomicrobium pectinilyticum]